MAIYLEQQEREYLLQLIKLKVDFDLDTSVSEYKKIRSSLAKKIKYDIKRLQDIAVCKPEYGEYIGHETKCKKCGTHDVGMGTTWELKDWKKEFASSGGNATLKKYGKKHFKELSKLAHKS